MKYPYSFESAVGYSFVLLISLWWLPVLGPIIIGYITGRKAGGPINAVAAMIIPIGAYFLLIKAIGMGWVHVPHIVTSYLSTTAAGAVMVPYFHQTILTGLSISADITSHLYYVPSSFFIMLAFAFIGGAMSKQIIMERAIYPVTHATKMPRVRKKVSVDVGDKKVASSSVKSTEKGKVKNLDKDRKFVVHEMDTKKTVPVKKKYGITFL